MSEHIEILYKDEPRMDAYYYSFDPTGNKDIDAILSAVAWAGKGWHNTDGWTENPYGDYGFGPIAPNSTAAEVIEEAANRATAAITAQLKAAETKGFIAGAVISADLNHARWAIQNDMAGARVLRDDALTTGDEVLLKNAQYMVSEARMWSQIARILLRRQREGL